MPSTILIVEDEDTDVVFLRRAFAKAGLTNPTQVARHGEEALDYLRGTGKYADRSAFPIPYLILLDLKLPHVTGLDVLKWIRQQQEFKTTSVLILTSSEAPQDIDTAYALGATAYLVKPAGTENLVALAKSIKDFWLTQNRPPSIFTESRLADGIAV